MELFFIYLFSGMMLDLTLPQDSLFSEDGNLTTKLDLISPLNSMFLQMAKTFTLLM